MPKIIVTLYGREYHVNCEEGQEKRLLDIAQMVDKKMRSVAVQAGNTTEPRLFMLTCLLMADELLDKEEISAKTHKEEDILVAAVEQIRGRMANLFSEGGRA
ncbi:MAG: cell division protein ZapA [Alphaproteobacteria bacterium]|nr:cell division protein ZapA [Alphaproteobacteria bacterium]